MTQPPLEGDARTVFLSLGSNLGDRLAALENGVLALGKSMVLEASSSVYETPAVGLEDQPPFLNLAVRARTSLDPFGLLGIVKAIEDAAGRLRPFPNAPRTLDIDIVLFGDLIVRSPELRIPHPEWKLRSFVAVPLNEVGASVVDPETGWRVEDVLESWPMEPEDIQLVSQPPNLRSVEGD